MVLVRLDFLCFVSWSGAQALLGANATRIPSGGISTFGPLIIKSFGFDKFKTILFNIPFGAVQIIATLGGAAFATYTKKKGPALALLCIPPIIGCVMLLTISHTPSYRAPLLVGYYLVLYLFPILHSSLLTMPRSLC